MLSDAVKGLVFLKKNCVPLRELFFFTHSKCKSTDLYIVLSHVDGTELDLKNLKKCLKISRILLG